MSSIVTELHIVGLLSVLPGPRPVRCRFSNDGLMVPLISTATGTTTRSALAL